MPRYLITTNCGYGDDHQVDDCLDQEDADQFAYEVWKESAETQAEYKAEELTPELTKEFGFEHEIINT